MVEEGVYQRGIAYLKFLFFYFSKLLICMFLIYLASTNFLIRRTTQLNIAVDNDM